MMHIYLAGPIRGLTYDQATDWREDAAEQLRAMGHTTASPMRGKEYLQGLGPLFGDNGSGDGSYADFPLSSAQGLFRRDCFDVRHCEAVLANLEGADVVSIGTVMEIAMAFMLGKYVLTVVEPGSVHDHAFVKQASSLLVPTLEAAMNYFAVVGQPYAAQPERRVLR